MIAPRAMALAAALWAGIGPAAQAAACPGVAETFSALADRRREGRGLAEAASLPDRATLARLESERGLTVEAGAAAGPGTPPWAEVGWDTPRWRLTGGIDRLGQEPFLGVSVPLLTADGARRDLLRGLVRSQDESARLAFLASVLGDFREVAGLRMQFAGAQARSDLMGRAAAHSDSLRAILLALAASGKLPASAADPLAVHGYRFRVRQAELQGRMESILEAVEARFRVGRDGFLRLDAYCLAGCLRSEARGSGPRVARVEEEIAAREASARKLRAGLIRLQDAEIRLGARGYRDPGSGGFAASLGIEARYGFLAAPVPADANRPQARALQAREPGPRSVPTADGFEASLAATDSIQARLLKEMGLGRWESAFSLGEFLSGRQALEESRLDGREAEARLSLEGLVSPRQLESGPCSAGPHAPTSTLAE